MDLPVTDAVTDLTCTACGAAVGADDAYCEACGASLSPHAAEDTEVTQPLPTAPAAPDGSCGNCGGNFAADGYCENCGSRAPNPRDHFTEQPAPWVAGVCDRGIRHTRNEDAMALAAGEEPGSRAVLVVCDGVTSAVDSDIASLAAAKAARDVLQVSQAQGLGTEASRISAITTRLNAAADAASEAVVATTKPDVEGNPASCTFVAVVAERDLVIAGSVGDSRAYWVPDDGDPVMLTTDDSYAAERIAAGVPRYEAEHGPGAHAITRWLGIDAPDHTPSTKTVELDRSGWLLACSDGLWNYCSEAGDLAELVRRVAAEHDSDPLATAAALVDFANAQGGQDNITAALARFDREAQ